MHVIGRDIISHVYIGSVFQIALLLFWLMNIQYTIRVDSFPWFREKDMISSGFMVVIHRYQIMSKWRHRVQRSWSWLDEVMAWLLLGIIWNARKTLTIMSIKIHDCVHELRNSSNVVHHMDIAHVLWNLRENRINNKKHCVTPSLRSVKQYSQHKGPRSFDKKQPGIFFSIITCVMYHVFQSLFIRFTWKI